MGESILQMNILNEKWAKYEFQWHILASKDTTQEYLCPAHQNNIGEKYQRLRQISITNHQIQDIYFGIL